jgi:Ca2+-binding EF-hand superfamily protein
MSYVDFLEAITPFNGVFYDQTGEEYLKHHHQNSVFKIIDADGSGTISFTEFAFYLTFTQMPDHIVKRRFKKQPTPN